MKKYLFYVILLIVCSFFINANKLRAEEICHIDHCFVPAPTIVIPENNKIFFTNPAIQGLTWKRTLVDIYLDGEYQGPVILKEEENHLQSFYWQPAEKLSVGKHYVFVIAHSTKGYDKNIKSWDQSKESMAVYFIIKDQEFTYNKNINQQKIIEEDIKVEKIQIDAGGSQNIIINKQTDNNANNQKGATTYQTIINKLNKQTTIRIIGLVIIIIILMIFILKWLINKKRKYLEAEMMSKIEKEENYPPPPPPINQDSLGI